MNGVVSTRGPGFYSMNCEVSTATSYWDVLLMELPIGGLGLGHALTSSRVFVF